MKIDIDLMNGMLTITSQLVLKKIDLEQLAIFMVLIFPSWLTSMFNDVTEPRI